MDYGEFFLANRQQDAFDESPEGQQLNTERTRVETEEQEVLTKEAQDHYQSSSAASAGPSQDLYDYHTAYSDGVNMNGESLLLPNKNIKPGVEVAGIDISTGEKIRSKYQDKDELILNGVAGLNRSTTDTTNGAPLDDIEHLGSIALGIQNEGGEYEEFRSSVPDTWNDEQAQIAWEGAENVAVRNALEQRLNTNDFDDLEQMEQPHTTEPIPPESLTSNAEWLSSAGLLYAAVEGDDAPDDGELSDWALKEMAYFNWNISYMAMLATRAVGDPQVAKSLYNLMNLYDNVGTNWGVVGRSTQALFTDPATYVGLGGPAAVAKVAGKQAIRAMLMSSAKTAGKVSAAEGGAYMAADTSLRQSVGISAGEENYDPMAVAGLAAMGVGVGFTLGTAGGPVLEKVGDWGKKAYKRLREASWASAGSPYTQIGALRDVAGRLDYADTEARLNSLNARLIEDLGLSPDQLVPGEYVDSVLAVGGNARASTYPGPGKPVQEYDKTTGKPYLAKGLSKVEQKLQAKRNKIDEEYIKTGEYDPYFDVDERYYANPDNYQLEGDSLTDTLAKTEKKRIEKLAMFDTPEARKAINDAFEAGDSSESRDWYAMGQLEDAFIKELGPVEGPKMFKERFADAMAATTGGADPGSNLLMAAYGNYLRSQGKSPPSNAYKMPHPIGGRYVTGNMKMYDKVINQGNPLTTAKHPKRHNFSADFLGHLDRVTIDEQMTKGMTAHMAKQLNAPPNLTYGVFEKIVQEEAAKRGLKGGNMQDVSWAGFKEVDGKPMIQWFNEMVARTAKVVNLSQKEVVKGFIRGDMPMYTTAGAAVGLSSVFSEDAHDQES